MTVDYIKNNNLLLFECISGSKAYGLDTPESDIDVRGVYYLPKDKFYGLNYIPQVSGSGNDEMYYELGRFVELLLKNNPNMLELLCCPEDCVLYRNPIMDNFTVDMFLSKLCRDTFAGYAISQIKKARGLNKKVLNPMSTERKSILDFCYFTGANAPSSQPLKIYLECLELDQNSFGLASIPNFRDTYAMYHDSSGIYNGISCKENSNDVCLSSIPKGEFPVGILHFNKDGYSSYCRKYKEYMDWVEKRNPHRYNNTLEHGKGYDSKNMCHVIRLLQMATDIFRDNTFNVRVQDREYLLSIKRGEMEYDDLLEKATKMLENADTLCQKSNLPDTPNVEFVESVLVKVREELYRN